MIFVTVGTHEQPFDRLIAHIDHLVETGVITEEVVIQSGFSTYEPKHCRWSKLLPHKEVRELVENARIVITHGGPASFMMPLQMGKLPVVVPRQAHYGEHVNDHQLAFAREVAQRKGNILLVEEVDGLADVITRYEQIIADMSLNNNSNTEAFNEKLTKLVDEMFGNAQ